MTADIQVTARTRILIADDHHLVLAGVRALLQRNATMEVIGEAADGHSALRLAIDLQPDILVLDLSMPGLSGASVVQLLRAQDLRCQILVLSMHEDPAYLRQLLDLGVSGYVVKRSAPEELVAAIRAVASGGGYIDPAIAGTIVRRGLGQEAVHSIAGSAGLSARETEVLQLAAAGYTNKELASRLRIGVKTIETYKARAMEKLGLTTRAELVRYAIAQCWFDGL